MCFKIKIDFNHFVFMLQTFNKNFVFVQLNLFSELFIKLCYDIIKNIVFS
jgi:hypothetical protein